MNGQKNKIVITTTLAIVSVLLLGGISFSLFPSQVASTPRSTVLSNSVLQAALSSINSSSQPITAYDFFMIKPMDGITIEKDGSINSTTAPIQRTGNTYTLTGDITNQTIIINRDNIVIDGAGHKLQGYNMGNAYPLENFDLQNVHSVTIKNFDISFSWQGIWIQNCSNIVIKNNSLSNINTGVDVNSANNTLVTDNTFNNMGAGVDFTSWYGFGPSLNNLISKNNITNSVYGISISDASSNLVKDNIVVNSYDPIYADENATVTGNTVINGIDAIGVNSNNIIYDNYICNFSESGLLLSGTNSIIYQNTIANCSSAVAMSGSSDSYPLGNNTLYHNNFINNTQPLLLMTNASLTVTYWDNGREGNYWSSYNGTSRKGNGIGDTPYTLGDNNTDSYPLIQPFVTQSANIDTSTAELFFALATITAAAGAIISLCLYVKFKVRKITCLG